MLWNAGLLSDWNLSQVCLGCLAQQGEIIRCAALASWVAYAFVLIDLVLANAGYFLI